MHEALSQLSPPSTEHPLFPHYRASLSPSSSALNEQLLRSAAASNLLSSINDHIHSMVPEQQVNALAREYFQSNYGNQLSSPIDVKNLIGSSLTAIGLDNVNEDEFDKAATNEATAEFLLLHSDVDNFERSATPATNDTSPIHTVTTPSTTQITRPVNIPHSFDTDRFSHSSSAKSPFDAPNHLFAERIESVGEQLVRVREVKAKLCLQPIHTPFPEPSTSSGGSQRPGELYKMAGFSQDFPTSSYQLQSAASPQSIFQRLSVTSHNSSSPSSSTTEIDMLRNRMLQMQTVTRSDTDVSLHSTFVLPRLVI